MLWYKLAHIFSLIKIYFIQCVFSPFLMLYSLSFLLSVLPTSLSLATDYSVPFLVFPLGSILFDIITTLPTLFLLVFAWHSYFHPLTFNLPLAYKLLFLNLIVSLIQQAFKPLMLLILLIILTYSCQFSCFLFIINSWFPPPCPPSFLPLKKKITYFIFIFGCAGSSLLCTGFLQLWQAGGTLHWVRGLLIVAASLTAEHSFRCVDFSSRSTQAQLWWCMDIVALRHVESSWIRNQTHVSCIGRQISIHCGTREVPLLPFSLKKIIKYIFLFFFSLMFGSYGSHLHTFNQL